MNMARFQLEIKLKKTTLRFCPTLLTSIKTILQLIFFFAKTTTKQCHVYV